MPEILSIGELLDLGGNSANLSAYIPFSALDYNASGAISGISGSALAGGVESSVVSSIVSSMVSGKADQSAVEECCSSMSAVVSSKLDASASGMFQPSGDYAYASSLSSKLDASASGYFQPSGEYIYASASGQFAPSGDYAYASSLSSKLDASASSMFQPSGQYQTAGDYADASALSGKLDASASSQFAPSGDYAYNSSLSSYVNYSAISGENSRITSIKGSAIGNALETLPLYVDSANMSAAVDELSSKVTIGVKSDVFALSSDLADYQPVSGMSSYTLDSSFTAYTASMIPVVVVADSADATGSNILYVVTGGL